MKMKAILTISAIGLLAGLAMAQRPGEAELAKCQDAVFGVGRDSGQTRTVQVAGGDAKTTFSMRLQKGEVLELTCGGFRIYWDESTGKMKHAKRQNGVEKSSRTVLQTEMKRLKRELAADPAWVIEHVRAQLDKYEVAVESNGEMSFSWSESFLLSDPEEKIYGVYGERLVIDPTTGEIREFGILSKDGNGRTVTDVVYEYVRKGDHAWDVLRTSYEKPDQVVRLTVSF